MLRMYMTRETYVASAAALRIAIQLTPDGENRDEMEAALINLRDAFHSAIEQDFRERWTGNDTPVLCMPQAAPICD